MRDNLTNAQALTYIMLFLEGIDLKEVEILRTLAYYNKPESTLLIRYRYRKKVYQFDYRIMYRRMLDFE